MVALDPGTTWLNRTSMSGWHMVVLAAQPKGIASHSSHPTRSNVAATQAGC